MGGGAGCDSSRLGLRPTSWVLVLNTVVSFEEDGGGLEVVGLVLLILKPDIGRFFVMTWAVTGLATWGGFEILAVKDCNGRSVGGIWAGTSSRGMISCVCMMNDPDLRTVVGIDMPMSDSVWLEGLKVVSAFGTLSFSCKDGTLCSGLLTIC